MDKLDKRESVARNKERVNAWWRARRQRVYKPHEYRTRAHCRDCNREYNREWMRNDRQNKKLKEAHNESKESLAAR